MSSRFVCNIGRQFRGRGITVQQHVIWLVYLSPIIYNLQNFHLCKISLISCFPAYDLYLHLPIVITSGILIYIPINFTKMETFLPFYTSISILSHYLSPSQLYTISNIVKNVRSTYLQQWLAARWIISNLISFIFNRSILIKYIICSSYLLLYHFL